MMQYVTITLGKDAYITLKTSEYKTVEEAMHAIVENKGKFMYSLFGGTDLIEDSNELAQVEISGIFGD